MAVFRIPRKYGRILSNLERRTLVEFRPGPGEIGYWRKLEKSLHRKANGNDFSLLFDRKHNLAIIRRRKSRIRKKIMRRKHILFEITP